MTKLDPQNSVLLLVDIQERLAAAMPPEQLEGLLRAATILLGAAPVLGVRVLATEQYPKGLGSTLPSLAEKLAALQVQPVEKMTFSAAGEPALVHALLHPATRHVIVIGMETHICVAQTVRDLISLGLDVHVPIDGVASRRADHREVGLRLCERAGAVCTTAETVLFEWLSRAGTDAFRTLSKLVRLRFFSMRILV